DFCRASRAAISDDCYRAVEDNLVRIGSKSLSLFIAFAQNSRERAGADEEIRDGDAFLYFPAGRAAQVQHNLLSAFRYEVVQLRLDLCGFALGKTGGSDIADTRLFHSRLNGRLADLRASNCELARLTLMQNAKLD